MDDSELQAIRQARLRELQAQHAAVSLQDLRTLKDNVLDLFRFIDFFKSFRVVVPNRQKKTASRNGKK